MSSSRRKDEEIGLRSDVGKQTGVTTVIDSRAKKHSNESSKSSEVRIAITQNSNESQSKLTEHAAEDFTSTSAWGRGIKKTMVVSTHRS